MILLIALSGSILALISSDPIGRTQYSVIAVNREEGEEEKEDEDEEEDDEEDDEEEEE